MDDAGSVSIESVFDTLLRMGLVMQMTVLVVTIMLTLVIVFLLNVLLGKVLIFAKVDAAPAVLIGYLLGQTGLIPDQKIVNATQNVIMGFLKWNP